MSLTLLKASNQTELIEIEKCSRIHAGILLGGQEKNEYSLSNPGISFQHVYSLKPNKKIGIGLGLGVMTLQQVNFIPVYLDFIGFLSDKRPYFVDLQGGYSVGWRSNNEDGKFRGGPYLNAGLGRKFRFESGFSIFILFDYRHQFANIQYSNSSDPSYRETLNYDFMGITLGVMLERK